MKTLIMLLLACSVAHAAPKAMSPELTKAQAQVTTAKKNLQDARTALKTARKHEADARKAKRAKAKAQAHRDAVNARNPLCQDADRDECRAILERATASEDMQDD